MAIPASTSIFTETLDPHETVDYVVDVSGLLESGESISTFTLTPLSEASALGLTILSSGQYNSTIVSGNRIRFWVNISAGFRGDPLFEEGAVLPIELSITTDSNPPRTKQRTIAIRVIQR